MSASSTRTARSRSGSLLSWVTALAGVGLVVAAGWWVTRSAVFDARSIGVTGNQELRDAAVLRVAGVGRMTNLFWFSPGTVERRLEASPWIASARVARALPSTLRIRVRERVPVAVTGRPARYLIASDGTVLEVGTRRRDLPVIEIAARRVAPGATVAGPTLEAVATLPRGLRSVVVRAGFEEGTLVLGLSGGARALYGDASDSRAKGHALAAVLEWAQRNAVDPAYIDVRAPSQPALRPAGSSSAFPVRPARLETVT